MRSPSPWQQKDYAICPDNPVYLRRSHFPAFFGRPCIHVWVSRPIMGNLMTHFYHFFVQNCDRRSIFQRRRHVELHSVSPSRELKAGKISAVLLGTVLPRERSVFLLL